MAIRHLPSAVFPPTLYQIDQREAYQGNSHLDRILAFDQDPNGHGSIESEGDEDHTIHPG
jgi:hypothetical protein